MKQFFKSHFSLSLEIFVRFFIWLVLILTCEYVAGKFISDQLGSNAGLFLLATSASCLGLLVVLGFIKKSNLMSHSAIGDLQRLYAVDMTLQLICAAWWYGHGTNFGDGVHAILFVLRNVRLVWWAKDDSGNFVAMPLPLTDSGTGSTRQALAAYAVMLCTAIFMPFLQGGIGERYSVPIIIALIGFAILAFCKQAHKEITLYCQHCEQIQHEVVQKVREYKKLSALVAASTAITHRQRELIAALDSMPDDALHDLLKIALEFKRQCANKPTTLKLVGGTDFENTQPRSIQ